MIDWSRKIVRSSAFVTALYIGFLLLWFRGVLNDTLNVWNHGFLVAAIAVLLVELTREEMGNQTNSPARSPLAEEAPAQHATAESLLAKSHHGD